MNNEQRICFLLFGSYFFIQELFVNCITITVWQRETGFPWASQILPLYLKEEQQAAEDTTH